MRLRDNRSVQDQVISGAKITGALVLSLAAIALFVEGYRKLVGHAAQQDIWYGSLLVGSVAIFLAATLQYWRLWFPGIPGFLGVCLFLGFYFGWFVLNCFGLWSIFFLILMFLMSGLSIRFSRQRLRMRALDRAVLFSSLICLLLVIANLLLSGLTGSVIAISAIGNGILLLSWLHSRWLQALRRAHVPPIDPVEKTALR